MRRFQHGDNHRYCTGNCSKRGQSARKGSVSPRSAAIIEWRKAQARSKGRRALSYSIWLEEGADAAKKQGLDHGGVN